MIAARILQEYREPDGHAARAAGRQPQGRLHRPRQVGARQGLLAPARRRQAAAGAPVPAHRPLQGAHHRAAGRDVQRRRPKREELRRSACRKRSRFGKGVVHVLAGKQLEVYSTKRACRSCGRSFAELDPRLFSYNSKHGWCATVLRHRPRDRRRRMERRARAHRRRGQRARFLDRMAEIEDACPELRRASRLNPEALAVRWQGKNIADYAAHADRFSQGSLRANWTCKAGKPRSRATSSPS